jgi:hypothetical protein
MIKVAVALDRTREDSSFVGRIGSQRFMWLSARTGSNSLMLSRNNSMSTSILRSLIFSPTLTLKLTLTLSKSMKTSTGTLRKIPGHLSKQVWCRWLVSPEIRAGRLVCMVADRANADCPGVRSSAHPAKFVFAHST